MAAVAARRWDTGTAAVAKAVAGWVDVVPLMVMENRVGDIVIEAWAVKAVVEPVVAAAKAATLAIPVPQSIIAAWDCLTGCTLVMGTDVMLVAA